jgi:hypothetical protein
MRRQRIITVFCVVAGLIIVLLASLRSENSAPGQIVPGPPTTPQPTVPCTPLTGCGRGPGVKRDVAFAWIDRYCNGDAVPTPPGQTTFALNYGLGGQSSGPVQFFGVATMNGVVIPTQPLAILQPGQKDTRIRSGVVPNDAVFDITITGTVIATGKPVIFGNGTDTRARIASGACPVATPAAPPTVPTTPGAPPPAAPPVSTLPPEVVLPPAQ